MTNKEMKELIQKQSQQISELISLVQELEKKNKPISVCTPWVTYSTTADLRLDKDGNRISSPITGVFNPLQNNEPICVMDSCLGNEITASGSSLPNETWDKEPEMIKAWDKLGIIGHNKSEGMV